MLNKFKFSTRKIFAKSVVILIGGTAAAQILSIATLPILTRLYTPQDFNNLAIYTSILSIGAAVACLRFELAIPIPEKDSDAAQLLIISLISAALMSIAFSLIIWLGSPVIFKETARNPSKITEYLWLIPIGILLSAIYTALQFWSARNKRFTLISQTRISQALGSIGIQLSYGLLSSGPLGLLLGQLTNSSAGILNLTRHAIKKDWNNFHGLSWGKLKKTVYDYRNFPKYSVLEALSNIAGIQLPILIIATQTIGEEGGYLLLAIRLISAPMSLIGTSVSQVYISSAAEEHRTGNLAYFTGNIIGGLIKIGVGPLIACGILAPSVIPIVLGNDWSRAGVMISWMTPWMAMQFIASPISTSLHIVGHQRIALSLQIFGLIIRVGSVALASILEIKYIFEIYAISGFVFYLIYFILVSYKIGLTKKEVLKQFTPSIPTITIALLLSIATHFLIKN